jgi:hypothetical protein
MITKIRLTIECQEYMSKNIKQEMMGFVLNINGKNHVIALHHFLPIKKVIETITNQKLSILINSSWSEFLVLDSTNINLQEYSIYTKIQRKLPKLNDELIMESISSQGNNTRCVMKVCGYDFIPYDNINTSITLPYIKASIISDVNDLAGLSGSPVFINNKLVGIFSKSYSNNQILLIIPIYVLIKNLEKIDNNNIFKYSEIPKKINKYNINNIKETITIYHPTLKYYIPFSTYLLLEGDLNKVSNIQNSFGETKYEKMIIDTKFGNMIDCNLIKSNQNTYLITPRLLSLLKRIFNQQVLRYILSLIDKSEKKDEEIWLLYDKGYFKII